MSNEFSRRTLAKGAAWAVPAVTIAAAAPAMASSKPCLDYTFNTDGSCKFPGANNAFSYHLVLKICNSCDTQQTVNLVIAKMTNNAEKLLTACRGTSYPITVSATIDAKACYTVPFGNFNSSSSASTIVAYDADGTKLFTADAPPNGECTGDPCAA